VRSGRYRIVVSDRSKAANFHLRGKGANARPGMSFRGKKTLRVRLSRGTYRYGSDRAGLTKRLRVRWTPNAVGRRVTAAPSFAAVAKPYFLSLKKA
jgi:hypothetical protein